ncbi:sensor histidine kinase [Sphingomonas endolithica]|uniref:sensor histidine kinase n=1 Tax=Sphingomonas endolithica TaxID=2972485 RepID=UPI0021AF48E0|nr:HAMP domain-containing sensor histidine kinase [Sphingomonas sp. ZFBP2030]
MLIGGFGVAVAMLSVATTATIVVLSPSPPALRMSARDAIAALRDPTPGFERSIVAFPPAGMRIRSIEKLIASELHRTPASVRVTWAEDLSSSAIDAFKGKPSRPALPDGEAITFKQRGPNLFEMIGSDTDAAFRKSQIELARPAFAVSVRQKNKQWLTVAPERPLLSVWRRNILISLGVTLLMLMPLAWIFARRLTRPFRALADALGDRPEALPQEGPRELREAAAAIDAMRNRLASEAGERARMLTAIAHDLRTPLTGLRLRIEAAPEPQRTRMVADVERMQAMIGEVLTFARDAAVPAELLDVRPLLAEVVREMQGQGTALCLLDGDDARVSAPAPALRSAIENLLQNAIDYAGGGIVSLERVATLVRIAIADSGPGIPVADRERLLRPFERGEASRNRNTGGAGLGLSIVREFATRFRGDLTLTDAPGGGTLAVLDLPAASPSVTFRTPKRSDC